MNLILSKEHGVNPSVGICYFCGEGKDVILFGNLSKEKSELLGGHDGKAPRSVCLDKEPCSKCKEWMKQGVILIGVRDGESGDSPFRTGEFHVIRQEAAERIFAGNKILTTKIGFVEQKVLLALGLPITGEKS